MLIQLIDENRLEAYSAEKTKESWLCGFGILPHRYPILNLQVYLPDKWSEADFVYGVKLGTTGLNVIRLKMPVDSSQPTYSVIIFFTGWVFRIIIFSNH